MMLSVSQDAKTSKGEKYGYLTGILYLQPNYRTCPYATKGCREACLNTAGMGAFNSVQTSRKNKTARVLAGDVAEIITDIEKLRRRAKKRGLIPCVRLNGTSDLEWDNIIQLFPTVQFYDYTKEWERGNMYTNYHITYSATEHTTEDMIKDRVRVSANVAIVFDEVPEEYLGIPVIDGDKHDLRFLDPSGVIVGLKAKGRACKDTTGFVRRLKDV